VLLKPRRNACKLRDGTEGNRRQADYWELALYRPIGQTIWWDPYRKVFRVRSNGTQNFGMTEGRVAWDRKRHQHPRVTSREERRRGRRWQVLSSTYPEWQFPRRGLGSRWWRSWISGTQQITVSAAQDCYRVARARARAHARTFARTRLRTRKHTHKLRSGEDRPIWAGTTWW